MRDEESEVDFRDSTQLDTHTLTAVLRWLKPECDALKTINFKIMLSKIRRALWQRNRKRHLKKWNEVVQTFYKAPMDQKGDEIQS